ncbi:hypothetical protein ZWY2020_034631 [Hordeum vulgare]|nr:hypothetical protein ZWY2020_034631 [Hordeum vulgare]
MANRGKVVPIFFTFLNVMTLTVFDEGAGVMRGAVRYFVRHHQTRRSAVADIVDEFHDCRDDKVGASAGGLPPLLPSDQLRRKHMVALVHVQKETGNDVIISTEGLLEAQLELYHNAMAYVKSAVVRAAVDLRIPDAIHRRGGAATLSDIATEARVQPTKVSHLRRLMRALTILGVFSVDQDTHHDDAIDVHYKLTPPPPLAPPRRGQLVHSHGVCF